MNKVYCAAYYYQDYDEDNLYIFDSLESARRLLKDDARELKYADTFEGFKQYFHNAGLKVVEWELNTRNQKEIPVEEIYYQK